MHDHPCHHLYPLRATGLARRTAAGALRGAALALHRAARGFERRAARVLAPRPTPDEQALVRARLATHGKLD
jgi:hypothetical protein